MSKNNPFLKEIGQKPSQIRELQTNNDFVPSIFVYKKSNDTIAINDSIYNKNLTKIRFNEELTLVSNNFNIKEKKTNDFDWAPFSIAIFVILLLTLAKELYKKSFLQLFESVISIKKFGLWQRDINSKLKRLFYFTIPAYLIIFPLAIIYLLDTAAIQLGEFNIYLYLAIFGLLTTYVLLRMLLINTSSKLFMINDFTSEHSSINFVSSSAQIILLIPLLILGFYQQLFFLKALILVLIVGFELFRIIRIFISAINKGYYIPFYFFLYFCTVEIIPLLLIIKTAVLFSGHIN